MSSSQSRRLSAFSAARIAAPRTDFHPLVRDFLLERLTLEIGSPAVRALHHRVAVALEPTNWFASAWHYREAGEPDSAARVIDAAVPGILAAGAFELAAPFLDGSAGSIDRPGASVLRARLELGRGSLAAATQLGQLAVQRARGGPQSGTAMLNLAAMHGIVGYEDEAVRLATEALRGPLSPGEALIAESIVAMRMVSDEGDLEVAADRMRRLANLHKREGLRRYAAISLLYLASALDWLGRPEDSLAAATEAEIELTSTGTRGVELAAILIARAIALGQLNRMAEAERVLQGALESTSPLSRDEVGIESTRIYAHLGSRDKAEAALAGVDVDGLAGAYVGLHALAAGDLAARRRDLDAARRSLAVLDHHSCNDTAAKLRTHLLGSRVALLERRPDARELANEVRRIALAQQSKPGRVLADLITGLCDFGPLHEQVVRIAPELTYCLSMLAEELAAEAHRLSKPALAMVAAEAEARPDRWRDPLLEAVAAGGESSIHCAQLLVLVGSDTDAAALRALAAKHAALKPSALAITQRRAQRVLIEDLGPVQVLRGTERLRIVRRKVLALLCYLGSRPGMAATRDEVLDALWPELGPDTAGNSLHQTIYFLRRVFEPDFREGMSAGYVEI